MKFPKKILILCLLCLSNLQGQNSLTTPIPVGAYFDSKLPSQEPTLSTGGANWSTESAYGSNLRFSQPKDVVFEPRSNHVYVLERFGPIKRVEDIETADESTTVLDLKSRIVKGDNGGVRSLVFHPEFNLPSSSNRNYIYVFYTTALDESGSRVDVSAPVYNSDAGDFFMRLSRFERNEATGTFPLETEQIMIQHHTVDRGQHFGGGLAFQNGFLIVGLGDTEYNRNRLQGHIFYEDTQRIDRTFQSAILRLDVDKDPALSDPVTRTLQGGVTDGSDGLETSQSCQSDHAYYSRFNISGVGYWIPKDNFFKDYPNALQEYHAHGVRNPWRIAVDPIDEDLVWFEVGSNKVPKHEEVNILEAGANYGWSYREGELNKHDETNTDKPSVGDYIGTEKDPLWYWDHITGNGSAISGGLIYRGSKHPELYGKIIFADHGNGKIYTLDYKGLSTVVPEMILDSPHKISGMSASADGQDILIAARTENKIFRLANSQSGNPQPPALLSELEIFDDMSSLAASNKLIPFETAAPLWSDRAKKKRWLAVPNDGSYDTVGEEIEFSEDGPWSYPKGSIFVKHFDLPIDERDPSLITRLETRFLIQGEDESYYGFTYRWREDGSDADLIYGEETRDIIVTREDGSTFNQTWTFPSRGQCMECHQAPSGSILGARSRQLNWDMTYANGETKNQLVAMNRMGIFNTTLDESAIAGYLKSAHLDDETATLEHRVRSYIDSNCSSCHRPSSDANRAAFDARLTTPLDLTHLINGTVEAGTLELENEAIIVPGHPEQSVFYVRDNTIGSGQMPPLGKNLIDTNYIEKLGEWIRSLDEEPIQNGLKAEYYNGKDFETLALSRVDEVVSMNVDRGTPIPGVVNTDLFSIRWSGYFLPEETDTYTFTTRSDDGVRLWIDGSLVIDDWTNHATKDIRVSVDLTENTPVAIRLEYFENRGGAQCQLFYSNSTLPQQIIPSTVLYTEEPEVATPQNGLKAEYYNGKDFETLALSRVDEVVSMNVDRGTPIPGVVNTDLFSIRWSGYFLPEETDTYTFTTRSDDGVRLWIDGSLVIDDWTNHATKDIRVSVDLTENTPVAIRLEYFENRGGAQCRLFYSNSTLPQQIIPSTVLYTEEPEVATPITPVMVYRVNAGGSEVESALPSGLSWSGDTIMNPSPYRVTTTNRFANAMTVDVTDPELPVGTPADVFSSERWGNQSWSFPVIDGRYQVILYFAEIYPRAVDIRRFNVDIEEISVLENYSVGDTAGGSFYGIAEKFEVDVTDGNIDIDFITITESPKVSAIEIISLDGH